MSGLKRSLRIERIVNEAAVAMLNAHHPLGAGQSFLVALGVFWNGRCEGVLTFGNPVSNAAGLCLSLKQDECLELRKMWMSDVPERNAESRALAVSARLIAQHYPRLKVLITYCDNDEKASSYRGAGWLALAAQSYVGEYLVNGQWLSARDANRKGVTKLATETKRETRRKFVYPLNATVAQLAERLATSEKTADRNRPGRFQSSTLNSPSLPLSDTGDTATGDSSSQQNGPSEATSGSSSIDSTDTQSTTLTRQSKTPLGKGSGKSKPKSRTKRIPSGSTPTPA